VGILISQSLQYTVIQEIKDANNNILILRLNVCGSEIIVASVYGPNTNDKVFFTDLRQFMSTHNDKPVICAGDWNATYSTLDGPGNIDIINMPNPPSLFGPSGWRKYVNSLTFQIPSEYCTTIRKSSPLSPELAPATDLDLIFSYFRQVIDNL
jgi:hypothetical protein